MANTPDWFGDSAPSSGGGGSDWFADPPVSTPQSEEHKHHSIVGTLAHVLTQTPTDFKDMALGVPGGLMQLHYALANADPSNPRHFGHSDPTQVKALAKGYVTAVAHEARHPLRHPGNTLADIALPFVSMGASTAFRVGAVAKAAEEAGALGEAAKTADLAKAALRNPAKGKVREVTAPSGRTARGHYSRSGLGHGTQLLQDAALEKLAGKTSNAAGYGPKIGRMSETFLNKRIDKWTNRQLRVEQAVLDSKVTKLAVATNKLDPVESRALRFAFEKLPINERLAADTQRVQEAEGRVGNVPGADPRTVKRLQDREQWGRDALQHLDVGPDGTASLKLDGPEGPKLGRIMDLMHEVYGDRETILKALDLMDEAALQGAKLKTGRFSLGAHWVDATPARIGKAPGVVAARKRVASLQRRFDKLYEREQPGSIVTKDRALNRQQAEQHLAELNLTHDKALKQIADAQFGPVDMSEVSRRNKARGKAKRAHARATKSLTKRGFKAPNLVLEPTVWDERFRDAQRLINDQIEKHPDHPVIKRWAERQDEIQRLSDALSPDPEEIFGGTKTKRKPITVGEEQVKGTSGRLHRLGTATSVAKEDLATAEARAQHYIQETGVVGPGEDLTLPADAGFIGYPRRASVFRPKIKVSSTGTLGHTTDPSLRASRGETIRYGLDEPNVGKILASRGHAANKLKMLARRVDLARKGGTAVPTRKDDVFIWNDDQIVSQRLIPPDVKDYLHDPEKVAADPEEAASLLDQARGAWIKSDWQLDADAAQYLRAAAAGKGVFVHRASLGDLGKPLPTRLEGKIGTTFDVTNNIQKSLLIYLKVNYPIVQALSNTAMNFIQQGPAAPVNIARAGKLMTRDPELAAQAGEIMGTGALMQLAGDVGKGSRAAEVTAGMTAKFAHWMSGYVDGPARLSAFIHEAGKEGFKTDAEIRQLMEDPQHAETLGMVAQRAKEAIVDYGEMSATEQVLIRRMFFVYPWLKGSIKWTAHFLRDHPYQASVLSQMAHSSQRENADWNAMLPNYLQGAFRSHPGGGGLINPSGVNPLQTPVSIFDSLTGLATGNKTSPEGAQFLTPAIATAVGLATGHNTLGIPLKGTLPAQLRQLLIDPTFSSQLLRASARSAGLTEGKNDATANVLRSLLGSRTTSKTFPNPNDPYWRFLFGGLYPRQYDEGALRRAKALEGTAK